MADHDGELYCEYCDTYYDPDDEDHSECEYEHEQEEYGEYGEYIVCGCGARNAINKGKCHSCGATI
jgi:hypothetical protein